MMAQIDSPGHGAVARRLARDERRPVPAWLPLALLALLAVAVYGAVFYGRGLDVPDEGLLLHVAERLANGEVPYRDVYFIYTPGFQYLLAGLFRLLGPNLAVEHALLFAVHVVLVLVVYVLAARLAWRPLAFAAALVVVLSGVSSYRMLVGLTTVLVFTQYTQRGARGWLVASGLLVGMSYLVGQEIGLYTLGATLGYLALEWLIGSRWAQTVRARVPNLAQGTRGPARRAAGDEPPPYRARTGIRGIDALGSAGLVVAAAAAVVLPWVTVMAAQGALPAMLDDTLRVTFFHQPRFMHVALPPLLPLVPDDLSANVVWGAAPYLFYVKWILYLPLLAVAAAIGVIGARVLHDGDPAAVRPVLPLALFAALGLGTLAFRADYYHLRQVLPVTLVLLAWLLTELRGWALRRGWSARTAAIVVLPLVVILAVNGGEAAAQRATLSVPLETQRGTVLVDATTARDFGGLLRDLAAHTTPGDAIYVAPAETAIYFLADRRNPTRFGQLVPTETEVLREHDGARQRELIAAVDAADVRWAVTANLDNVDGVPFAGYAPLIASYLEARFEPVARYGYWTLQRRR
jgi:hypothetical protein